LERFRFTPVISPISEGVIYHAPNRITSIINRAMSAGKEHTIQQTKQSIGYTDRNNPTSQFYHERGQETTEKINAPGTFKRRIGNTVYRVNVHYSSTSKETINDKITRLVKNDVSVKAAI